MKKIAFISLCGIVLSAIVSTIIFINISSEELPEVVEPPIVKEIPKKFDIPIDDWTIYPDTVRKGDFLGTIMGRYGITAQQIDKIAKMSTDTFNTTLINVGRPVTIFSDTIIDSIPQAKIFIYENSKISYTKYDFRNSDTILIEKLRKHVDTVSFEASGRIEYSLWQTIIDKDYNWELAIALSQTFAWTVDFYSLQPQDWFKVVYEKYIVDGDEVGIGEIKAGVFYHGGRELWSIPFVQDSSLSYFDIDGNSMRKTFLLAPLKFTRVSSRYSHARYHPVHHNRRPHLAVDYAAPTGTPVYAASDGTITKRTYGKGAGYYVVIKHNSIYTTVYMHFSRFGKFQVGDRVNQGDIIGYVGSTGWSTGPHLHYEIHENGAKIDPLKFNPPPAEPVDSANIERFHKEKQYWIDEINKIELIP